MGSTLDVMRTAQEMADVAVGRLADFIGVDLLDGLFRGVEPRPSATGSVALRRAAQQCVLPGIPESVVQPGDVDHYPESSPPRPLSAHGSVVAAPHPGRSHRELAGRRPRAREEGHRAGGKSIWAEIGVQDERS